MGTTYATSTIRRCLVVLAVLAASIGFGSVASAQSNEPNVSARVATPGFQDLTVRGADFPPGLAIFVLPCPGVANVADAAGDVCDTSDLSLATSNADGSFEIEVRWFVPPEGLVFAASDAASTATAASRVAVADRDPVSGECRVLEGAQGVSLSWFPIAGAEEYVYRITYADRVRYDRVSGDFTTIAIAPGENVSVALSAAFSDGTYSPAQECGTATTSNIGSSDRCTTATLDGAIAVGYPAVQDAVAYVWALKVNGGPISYDRVAADVTGIAFNIGSGATGSVRISAVFPDGTYSDNVQCSSVEAS